MKEIWKDIKGYEGLYQVSNIGRVRIIVSRRRSTVGHIMKPWLKRGYLKVGLVKDGVQHNHFIHRLVAETFIPNPLNKPQVNHIDEVKTNCSVENLEWVTNKENCEWSSSRKRIERGLPPKRFYGKVMGGR